MSKFMNGKILYTLLLILSIYWILSYPDRTVMIDPKTCKLKHSIDGMKAAFQGKSFWKNQLKLLDRDIESHLTAVDKRKELMDGINRKMEEARQKHGFRPPESSAADNLRKQADATDKAEFEKLERYAHEEMASKLSACRPSVEDLARD